MPKNANPTPDRLLTAVEVAEILNVAPYTVRKFARDGALTPVRLGGSQRLRFRPEDVTAFIEEAHHA